MNWPWVHASGVAERVPSPASRPGRLVVPDLLGQHQPVVRGVGDRVQVRGRRCRPAISSYSPRSPREQRPQAAARLARRVVEEQVPVAAVGLLAVAVEREPVPDRPARRVDPERIRVRAAPPSPTFSELRIVWSFHFFTPNSTRPRNELSTISRWSTGAVEVVAEVVVVPRSGPASPAPWSRGRSTASASTGRSSSRSTSRRSAASRRRAPRTAAALPGSPFARAMSAAQIRPAISVAIVFGE